MTLKTQIFQRIVKYFEEVFDKPSSDVGDGYGAEWSLKNKSFLTIHDDDSIIIAAYSDYDNIYDGSVYVDSVEDFDVFLKLDPSLGEHIDVTITSKMGYDVLTTDFDVGSTHLKKLGEMLKPLV